MVWPIPGRISLNQTLQLIDALLDHESNCSGFDALVAALFLAFGRQFGGFNSVRRKKARVASIECITARGEIVIAVEPVYQHLSHERIELTVRAFRSHAVCEAYFVTRNGVHPSDDDAIARLIEREQRSGQNIYVTELAPLCRVLLALLGESGRRTFLECVCRQLEEHSDVHHRRAWAELLRTV